jgi:hypothetical protein
MITNSLIATDRCDRCAAQAHMRATMVSGAELLFCAHHGREYEAGLRAVDADIYWESDKPAEIVIETADES